MKGRILQSLYQFGHTALANNDPLFIELQQTLNYTAIELQERAKKTLKELLHNYAFFEVATIDRFNHKIIRTFARDLQLSQNFEVVLDTESLLDRAIAKILNRAGDDKTLTKVLIDFSLEKIDDSKSWNITFDLKTIGKILFQENHLVHLQKIEKKTLEDFSGLKQSIKLKVAQRHENIIDCANQTLELIHSNNLAYEDFTRGYFPKFIEGLSKGNFNVNFNAAWKQNFATTPLYNKTTAESTKQLLDQLHPQFIHHFKDHKRKCCVAFFFKAKL